MMHKWEYPTENVMTEYFSLLDQLEKSGTKCNEDLIEEKELQKKLEEIKQRREEFRLLSVKFSNLKHIIESARPPKRTHSSDPQFIIDREKTMADIQEWKNKNKSETRINTNK